MYSFLLKMYSFRHENINFCKNIPIQLRITILLMFKNILHLHVVKTIFTIGSIQIFFISMHLVSTIVFGCRVHEIYLSMYVQTLVNMNNSW